MDFTCSGTVAWCAMESGRPISIDMRTKLASMISDELGNTLCTNNTDRVVYTIRSVQNVAFDLSKTSDEEYDNKTNASNVEKVTSSFDVLAIEGNSLPIYALSALRGKKWVYIALFDRVSGKFLRWQKYSKTETGGCDHGGCHCGKH